MLTASSPKAAATTSGTTHGSRSAKSLVGRGSSGDTRETTPSEQHTRQPPAYRKDLVCDRIICGRYKDPTGYRIGKWAKGRESYEHHANINFCLGGITNEIHAQEKKVLVTIHDHAVHSFLVLMQSRVDVLRNSKHYHSHSKYLTILDRGMS